MIRGEKTLICGITRECVPKILEWVNQPELKQFTGTLYPVSEFEHEEWIHRKAISVNEKLFAIKEIESGMYIGTIGLKNVDYINSNAEIYISIGDMNYLSDKCGGGYKEKRLWL